MILLDVYMNAALEGDGAEAWFAVVETAHEIGDMALTCERQMFVLTDLEFDEAASRLATACGGQHFLKVQEISGRFLLSGLYPEAVYDLVDRAQTAGALSLGWSQRPDPMAMALAERAGASWVH